MSGKLHRLEQQWEAFQKSIATTEQSPPHQTAPHVNQLRTYQQLQQNVNMAFTDWEKEHQEYQKQLDECSQQQQDTPPTPATNGAEQMPLKELIDEHQRLTNQLDTQVQSTTDIKRTMELWAQFDTVHTALTQQLQTQD